MYTYTCCRCTNCSAQVVLVDRADSETVAHRPSRPRSGSRGLSLLPSGVRSRELLPQRECIASLDACQSSNPFRKMNGSPDKAQPIRGF